jgi:ABC-2 type transport system permease protein
MEKMSLNQRKSMPSDTENKLHVRGGIGLRALFHKELGDHLTSKRFLILLLLIGTTSFASLYGALSGLSDSISSDSSFVFLKLYTLSGNSIPSFMSFIALLGPVVGLALGFDAINSERMSGTLNRLVAQPIYRDSIIIGKFLAGVAVIASIIYSMGIGLGAIGVLVTGLIPTVEEALRILVFLTFTVIYIAFWLAMSILFSVVCRHSATSALASIAVWIFFAIFMSLVASIIANAVYPINTQYTAMFNSYNNYTLELDLNRISPYYLYSEAVSTVMNPSVRSVNVVTMDQLVGAISGYLSLGQSLLLVWPHLTGLAALMLIAFGGSYIGFMRQEVRTN